jgi:hypothetical protein
MPYPKISWIEMHFLLICVSLKMMQRGTPPRLLNCAVALISLGSIRRLLICSIHPKNAQNKKK